MPFLTEIACAEITTASMEKADHFEEYQPDVDNNSAPGLELRLDKLDEAGRKPMREHVEEHVFAAIKEYWRLCFPRYLRMPFILRTGEGARPHLDLHHDVALISGAVRLTDGHEGGMLAFPRQDWKRFQAPDWAPALMAVASFASSFRHSGYQGTSYKPDPMDGQE